MWVRGRRQCAPGLNNPASGLEDSLSAALLAVGKLWEQLQEEWSLYLNKNEKWERDKRQWGCVLAVLLLQWKRKHEGKAGEKKQPWKVLRCPAKPKVKVVDYEAHSIQRKLWSKHGCYWHLALALCDFNAKNKRTHKIVFMLCLYIALHNGVFFPSTTCVCKKCDIVSNQHKNNYFNSEIEVLTIHLYLYESLERLICRDR